MYLVANLPESYGAFNQIRKENYPFSVLFTDYLEQIANFGIRFGIDASKVTGRIEDELFSNERLPDIPKGEEPVKFRFSIENEVIAAYFKESTMSNKTILMLIIRMTLRLTEAYGTSLSRLSYLIKTLSEEKEVIEQPAVKQQKPVVKRTEEVSPVTEPAVHIVKKKEETESVDMVKRLEGLVKKGETLLEEQGETNPVIETNPLLGEFFG